MDGGDPGNADELPRTGARPAGPWGPVPEIGDSWTDVGAIAPVPARPEPPGRPRLAVLGAVAVVVVAVLLLATFFQGSGGTDGSGSAPVPDFPPPVTQGAALVDPAAGSAASNAGRAGPTTVPGSVRASGTGTGVGAGVGQPVPAGPTPTAAPTAGPTVAPTGRATATPPVWTTLTVQATKVFAKGDSVSTNRTRLLLQTDGDLVIIDEFATVRWRSGTAGRGDHAVFQDDGHFVVYDAGNVNVWSSRTAGNKGAVLVLAANGNVNIVFNGAIIWSSDTAH